MKNVNIPAWRLLEFLLVQSLSHHQHHNNNLHSTFQNTVKSASQFEYKLHIYTYSICYKHTDT